MGAVLQRLMLASIHDVTPVFMRDVTFLVESLRDRLNSSRLAMLVVPNYWGNAPISEDKQFQVQLRQWAHEGADIFVHGWFHKDEAKHGWLNEWKARYLTNREGEFLGLDEQTARQRIVDGRSLIEDITGLPIAGFVAPAWLYGAPAKQALRACGIHMAEDHFKVWDPQSGAVLSSSPVISWATRSWMRAQSSKASAAIARHAFTGSPAVRLAVHPSDRSNPSVLKSINRTIDSLRKNRRAESYAALAASLYSMPALSRSTHDAGHSGRV